MFKKFKEWRKQRKARRKLIDAIPSDGLFLYRTVLRTKKDGYTFGHTLAPEPLTADEENVLAFLDKECSKRGWPDNAHAVILRFRMHMCEQSLESDLQRLEQMSGERETLH